MILVLAVLIFISAGGNIYSAIQYNPYGYYYYEYYPYYNNYSTSNPASYYDYAKEYYYYPYYDDSYYYKPHGSLEYYGGQEYNRWYRW